MIPATTSRHGAAVHTRSLNRLWYDGTVLFYNRSGEKYSATGILEVLNDYFEVRIFVPSEYGDVAIQVLPKRGITLEQIIILPLSRRQVLVRNLLGIRVPGLEIGKQDWVWTPNERILPTLERQACVVHDLMPVTVARSFPIAQKIIHRIFFRRLRNTRCLVFCHSNTVKRDLVSVGGIEERRICVVPLGLQGNGNGVQARYRGRRPLCSEIHLLYLSAYQRRKNFEVLVQFVRRFMVRNTHYPVRLTVAGFGVRTQLAAENHGAIRILDYITELEKERLLEEADIYVNPSAAEGFGITNLEAQRAGLPVLCSDIPVFREVLGDSAVYFRWNDYQSFERALRRVVENPTCAEQLRQKGLQNTFGRSYHDFIVKELVPVLSEWMGRSAEREG